MPPQRTFDRFARLPEELQIMTWKYTAQVQRTISIERLHTSFPGYYHRHHATHDPPPMLQVCRLSRVIGLESYQILGAEHNFRHPIYFSPASDVAYCRGVSSFRTFARETQVPLGSESPIRFVVFKGVDLDAITALNKTVEPPLREGGIFPRYTRSEGLRGIYHCAQCGCKVSQIYGLEFKWTSAEVEKEADQKNNESGKAKEKVHIRVLGRSDIDREFGNGPWNRDRCLACPCQEGLTWTVP